MTPREDMALCLSYRLLVGARPGELDAAESDQLAEHLSRCPGCARFAADAGATEGLVAEALLLRASQRDFAPFVDQVMARIEAPRPAGLLERLGRLVRRHPKAVIGGALAPLAAGLALALVLGGGRPEVVASRVEMNAEGVTTILQSSDGPVVLLDDDDEES